jgi:short subunit dehydrogenase-like uncharacterized protein
MLLIYGCTGYTGRLIVAEAVRRGLKPVLAGRRADAVRALAEPLGLAWRAFPVEAPDLAGVTVLLNSAGPFVDTAGPLVEACLASHCHYVDVTGEIAVFEALARRDDQARAAGVCLLPGAGFDVVPTDCLAAHLARRLAEAPGAGTPARLELAILGAGGLSHGTATTAARNLGGTGAARVAGRITPEPVGARTRRIDFGDGRARWAMSIPWGDVSTAFRTIGAPDIVTYLTVPPLVARTAWLQPALQPLLGWGPVRRFVQARIDAAPAGPTDEARARGWSRCWGRLEDAAGHAVEAWWKGPEGYTLTAITAVDLAHRLQDPAVAAELTGFRTPAGAFGADYAMGVPGAERGDVTPPTG